MAPYVRNNLSQDILVATSENDQELTELDEALEKSKAQLAKTVDSEQFVRMRLERYQELLRKRAKQLEEPRVEDDENGAGKSMMVGFRASNESQNEALVSVEGNDRGEEAENDEDESEEDEEVGKPEYTPEERQRHLAKLAQDRAALAKVEVTHQQLVASVRNLRKQILVLEKKRSDIGGMTEEVKDFVIASAEVEEEEEAAAAAEEPDSDDHFELSQVESGEDRRIGQQQEADDPRDR